MNRRENILRTARFGRPESIPLSFYVNEACWNHYEQEWLKDQMASHPLLFPGYHRPKGHVQPSYSGSSFIQQLFQLIKGFENTIAVNARKDVPFRDDWGCLWETTEDGITGIVTEHPLADWASFDEYTPPDPRKSNGLHPFPWGIAKPYSLFLRLTKGLRAGGLVHGHTFLRLCDIRGYENLIFDMVDENPLLDKLIGQIEEFNLKIIQIQTAAGVEYISFPEDLGMEVGPMISPDLFRKYIKPSYTRIMAPARKSGAVIHMHSDGDIRTLAEDLIEGGVDVLNLQDQVNGIDWIEENLKSRVCIDLDIDRVKITPFGSPAEIHDYIREVVERLGSPQGGFMMIYGLYPGVPEENVTALMDAMEKYANFYR